MTKNELKDIIRECIIEEESKEIEINEDTCIYLEFSKEYMENKLIAREINEWVKNVRKLSISYYFTKKPNLTEANRLKEMYDKNKSRWTSNSAVKAIYDKSMVKQLYVNLIKLIDKMEGLNNTKTIEKPKNIISEDEAKKLYNELINNFEKILPKLKSSSDYKKKCKESSIKMNDSDYKIGYEPDLEIDDFESICKTGSTYNAIISVIDDDQIVRIYYSWILYDLVNLLKEYNPDIYKKFNFEYGDGDEGCIYVSI